MNYTPQINLQDLRTASLQTMRQSAAGLQDVQAQGNPFFMIIQNMLEQMNTGEMQENEGGAADLWQALTNMLQDSPEKTSLLTSFLESRDNSSEDEQTLNAEALTLAGMNNADILAVFNSMNTAAMEGEGVSDTVQTALNTVQAAANTAPELLLQNTAVVKEPVSVIKYDTVQNETEEGRVTEATDIVSTQTTTTKAAATEKQEIVTVQREFFNAVNTVKKTMTQNGKTAEADDAQNLAEEAIAQSHQPKPAVTSVSTAKTETADAAPAVLDQITTGISENLNTGKTEFVMKLKPEALGEITVKLVEESGKKTLQIITGSTHTANLINNELAALREAVKPMQVEVHDVIFKAPETAGQEQLNLNLAGQHMGNQHFFGEQRRQFSSHPQNTGHYNNEYADDFADETQQLMQDGLNIYI